MRECPSHHELADWVRGILPPAAVSALIEHVSDCDTCRETASNLAKLQLSSGEFPVSSAESSSAGPSSPVSRLTTPPRRGSIVHRYVIIDTIGAGGMGVVYTAYDPELDRKIALKLISPQLTASPREESARARLAREAQAMARVSHPNVVTVHDAGNFGDEVFVAMELVDGTTLGAAVRARTRPVDELVSLFLDAGKGLAAVHRAGLVHRDFKPDNVLIANDEQVRVTDFGLARLTDFPLAPELHAEGNPQAELPTSLSRAGALLGTPAYMAPEQLRGEVADARSDQFSFCVALYEALYRERPFGLATNAESLAEAMQQRRPPIPTQVPRGTGRFLSILQRGLQLDPAERYPDMETLLTALTRDPMRTWRRLGALGLLVGAVALAVFSTSHLRSQEADCSRTDQALAGIWDASRKETIHRSFSALGVPNAESTWTRFAAHLDKYTGEWVTLRRGMCEAARSSSGEPDPLIALRTRCLDRRLGELRALTDLYMRASPAKVHNAAQALVELASLQVCQSLDPLQSKVLGRVRELADSNDKDVANRLAEVRMLSIVGSRKEALTLVTEVAKEAERRAPSLLPEALFRKGQLEARLRMPKETSVASLRKALRVADESMDDEMRVQSLIVLVFLMSQDGSAVDYALGHEYAAQAASAIKRLGGALHLEARMRNTLGTLRVTEKDYEGAKEEFESALRLLRSAPAPDSIAEASTLSALGLLYGATERYEEALTYQKQALAVREQVIGTEHPENITYVRNIAWTLLAMRRYREAQDYFERAQVFARRFDGMPPGLQVAIPTELATCMIGQHQLERAQAYLEEAQSLATRILQPTDPRWMPVYGEFGELYAQIGKPKQAIESYERAIAMEKEPSETDTRALAQLGLARLLLATHGDRARARSLTLAARAFYVNAGVERHLELERLDEWMRTWR